MNIITTIGLTLGLTLGLATLSNAALTHHWNFDSDLTDSVGSNNGTAVGAATIDTTVMQFGAGSLDLTSGTDYSSLGSTEVLTNTGGFSLSLWAQKRAGSTSGSGITIGLRSVNTDYIWLNGNGNLIYRAGNSTTNFTWTPDNASHHIVVVNDGTATDNVTLYLDGVAQTAQTNINDFSFNSLGFASSLINNGLDGNLDEVMTFDNALTSAEVTSLMNTNTVPEPSSTALLGLGGLALILRRRK